MSKLISPETFRQRYFAEENRPSIQTVWRWLRDGHLPSRRIRRRFFIHPDDAQRAANEGIK